jgi:hypothetical protein
MKNILSLIGGGNRDEVILQTAFAAASASYIRRADGAASGSVETRHEPQGSGVGAAGARLID